MKPWALTVCSWFEAAITVNLDGSSVGYTSVLPPVYLVVILNKSFDGQQSRISFLYSFCYYFQRYLVEHQALKVRQGS